MKLLAIDTATENCSVCYCDTEAGIRDEEAQVAPRRHAELLLPMVDALCHRHALALRQLDAICFGRGPGSFTGVRIAASAAQGLALGAGCRVRGVSTLQTLAAAAGALVCDGLYVSAIDARMSEVYLGLWRVRGGRMEAVGEERVLSPAAAARCVQEAAGQEGGAVVYAGTGVGLLADAGILTQIPKNPVKFPGAGSIIDIVVQTFDTKELCDPQEALPVYIRNEVVARRDAAARRDP